MFTLFIVLHVIFCLFLILVILLQTGKGAGIGAAFGGGSQTVFGPRGAGSFIGKVTGTVAALFMLTSIILAYQSTSKSGRVAARAEALQTVNAEKTENVDLGESVDSAKEENSTAAAADAGAKTVKTDTAGADAPDTAAKAEKIGVEDPKKGPLPDGIDDKAAAPPGLEAAKAPAKPKALFKPKAAPKSATPAPKGEASADAPAADKPKPEPKPEPEAKPEPKPEPKPAPEAEPAPSE